MTTIIFIFLWLFLNDKEMEENFEWINRIAMPIFWLFLDLLMFTIAIINYYILTGEAIILF